jgi:rhamnosyltransferase
MEKVICVLVLYNPDYSITSVVIDSILPQVDTLFIADNSSIEQPAHYFQRSKIAYSRMPGNIGIAAAQNVGIEFGIKNGYKYLFFLVDISQCF